MSSEFALVAVVGVIGVVTLLIRLSFIGLMGNRRVPDWFIRSLRYVPPAVLGALIWPDLLMANGGLSIGASNHRLLAGVVAIAAALLSRNVFITLAVGLATLWLLNTL